jgi:ATP-dependent DNA ligase
MTMPIREQMTQHPDRWLGSVIEIKHMGQMPSGAYRHPQFKRKRDDKDPNECRLEES